MITARSLVSASVRDRGILVWGPIDHWPSGPISGDQSHSLGWILVEKPLQELQKPPDGR